MHNKDQTVLEKLFTHPVPMNLEWKEVRHMLENLGVQVDYTKKGHIKIKVGNESKAFKTFHKMLDDKHEIKELQDMLETNGLAPESVEW